MVLSDFTNIEFGVCFQDGNAGTHYKIPVDASVKTALVEMRNNFIASYDSIQGTASTFQPSEKYEGEEKLRIDLNTSYLSSLKAFFNNRSIPINNVSLSELLPDIEYYYAEFIHTNGSRTIGVKRPNQFKALLKKKIVRIIDNTLKAVDDNIFKLDIDFDFLIHSTFIEILHPAGFIFISDLEQEIFNSIPATTRELGQTLTFVDFNAIGTYLVNKSSKRGAKLLASIKARADLANTSSTKLVEHCTRMGFTVTLDGNGKLATPDNNVIDFLEVLDRRQYDFDITSNAAEVYIAGSRRPKS